MAGIHSPALERLRGRAADSTSRVLPYLSLAVGIGAISLATFFVRWGDAPGPVTSTYRMGLAMVFQLPYFLYSYCKLPIHRVQNPPVFAVLAGVSMGLCLILWSIAVLETRVANASLLANCAPLFVTLFAWLVLRQKLKPVFWSGLLLALLGMVVVVGMDFLLYPSLGRGDFLALASAVFYAAYYLLVEQSRRTMSTLNTIWLIDLCSTLVLLAYCLVAGLPLAGYGAHTWLMFSLNAIIPQIVGYFALTYALGRLPAWIVSPTMILQPVITSLLAIPLLHEALGAPQLIGGTAVVIGIYLINRTKQSHG